MLAMFYVKMLVLYKGSLAFDPGHGGFRELPEAAILVPLRCCGNKSWHKLLSMPYCFGSPIKGKCKIDVKIVFENVLVTGRVL